MMECHANGIAGAGQRSKRAKKKRLYLVLRSRSSSRSKEKVEEQGKIVPNGKRLGTPSHPKFLKRFETNCNPPRG